MPRKKQKPQEKVISITTTEATKVFQKYFKMMRNADWGHDMDKAARALAIMYHLQQDLFSYTKDEPTE